MVKKVEWNFILIKDSQAGRTRKLSLKVMKDAERDEEPISDERKDVELNKDLII